MKRTFGLCLLGAAVVLLSQACGSDDPKKNDPNRFSPDDGGEGGVESGGASNTGATGGSSGSSLGGETANPNAGGPAMTGDAGEPNMSLGGSGPGEGGSANMTGDAGASGAPQDDCAPGFGECDGDPGTVCEQDLSSPLTCGDCDTTCSSANGAVVCQDLACTVTSCNANYGDCNDDGTDGCETNLLNNADDCGVCGRDCATLGATCSTNKCSTIAMQQAIAGGNDGGANVMWVYSAEGLMNAASYNYSIRRYPLSGTGTNIVWVGDTVTIGHKSMLVEGSDLLWAQRGTPDVVLKKPITAAADVAPTDVFYPEYQPMFLTRVVNTYYWITGDYQAGEPSYVYSRLASAASNVPGTRIVTVSQGTHGAVRAFAVTSNGIYWVTSNDADALTVDNGLRTTGLNGGAPTDVPAVAGAADGVITSSLAPSLQAVGDTLYFTRTVGTSAINGVYRYQVGDTSPTRIVSADQITSIMVDDTHVYYSRQNTAGVWRAPLSIGAGVQISEDGVTRLVGHDDDYVYAISSGCCNSDIHKVIKVAN